MPGGAHSGPVHARQAREAAKEEGKEGRERKAGQERQARGANETDRGCSKERQKKIGTL
jgi:hypothetical protein